MNDDIARRIRRTIREAGPITFAEFMETALYAPGGFYDVPPVGPNGHFVTSPHVHGVFAELLANGLRRMWRQLGEPSPYRIVEAGAGDGTLARGLLDHLPDLPIDYVAVERSRGARAALEAVAGVTVAERLGDLDPVRDGVILANELLDNLPFRRVRIRPGGAAELRVGLDSQDEFVEVESDCDPALSPWTERAAWRDRDLEIAVPVAALAFVAELARTLQRGWALLIDYGAIDQNGSGGPRGYRSQRLIDDVLRDPGSADITAEVDFGVVGAEAARRGLRVDGIPSQREVLVSLGLEGWARAELERQGSLVRERAGLAAVRAWSGRSRATLLVDPAALGRLRWLVLSQGGVAAPDWMPNPSAEGSKQA